MIDLAAKYHFTYEDIVTPVLSTLTDNQVPFIQLLTDLSGAQTTGASGSNDQGFFENVGIRTVVFGPGQHDQCHIANEYILLEKLEKHIEILQSFIKKYKKFTDRAVLTKKLLTSSVSNFLVSLFSCFINDKGKLTSGYFLPST